MHYSSSVMTALQMLFVLVISSESIAVVPRKLLEFLNIKVGMVYCTQNKYFGLHIMNSRSKNYYTVKVIQDIQQITLVNGQESLIIDASSYSTQELNSLINIDQLGIRAPSVLVYEEEMDIKNKFIPFKVNQQVYSFASSTGAIYEQYEVNSVAVKRKIAQVGSK